VRWAVSNFPQVIDEDGNGRPTSIHAEMTILGACLVEPTAIPEAAALITPDDFSLDSHRKIYSAVLHLFNAQKSVDIITITDYLAKKKELASIGGLTYMASLSEGLPRKLSIESYVRIVRDKSMMRKMMEVCDAGLMEGNDGSREALDVVNQLTKWLNEIASQGAAKDTVTDSPTMAKDAEKRLITHPSDEEAIPTGIEALDAMTGGGMRRGEVWVIGASPLRGKTSLARQIGKHCVWRDIRTYVHSGEMSKESWFDVTACLLEGMQAWKIREPRLMSVYDKESLTNGIRELGKMPLYLSDTGGIHIDRLIWNMTQADCLVNIIDYVQIINAAGDDRTKVTTVAQRLRMWAKDNNKIIILLSQSPRPDGKNINSRPNMFNLKESGALEEVAHVVVLPYRPIDIETGKFTGEDELIIGKSRWGSIGSIPVFLNGPYLRFDAR
jgi:replicative DNA helicase